MNKKLNDEKNPAIKARQTKKALTDDAGHKLKINPDPRANENIPEEERDDTSGNTEGVGSEITDGEDG